MDLKLEDVQRFEYMWKNNGTLQDGTKMKIEDALAVSNAPMLMPKVISNIVKEAMEPLLVGTSLLQRINYSYGQTITFPAVGALVAADIPDGAEYPERSPQMGAATVQANIGKTGLAVKVTDEMLRYSQFDIIGMFLREAGRALARWKEEKIFNYIRGIGVKVFDNVTPTRSLKGVTTGRDLAGSANGSLTMDDLFDAFAQVMVQGFIPNTLLMHPLTWLMFVKDPVLRAFALQNGGGTMFASWSGNVNQQAWGNSLLGGLAGGAGQNVIPGGNAASLAPTELTGYNPQMNSAPNLPSYLGIPFRIIVSHYVPFDPRRKLTDIYIFDGSELGALVVDEEVTTDEFTDPRNDIRKIKIRERYGLAMFHEGQQIAVLKNIHVVPNEIVLPAQASIDVSGSLAPISPTASVL
jgi:hypothetical protein